MAAVGRGVRRLLMPETATVRSYQELKDQASKARQPYDRELLLNTAFYLNQQYVEWVPDTATISEIANDDTLPRPIINKIMHFVSSQHAMALQHRPYPDVLPASTDPEDVSEAAVCNAYCNWLADPQVTDFDAQLSEAVLWAMLGEGWLKWTWNDSEQRGDISAPSPLDVYPDPYSKNIRYARYIIHSQFMDIEQVYDLYGKEVPPQQQTKTDLNRAALLRDMGIAPALNGAVVNELWMKPNRRFPEGRFCCWTGDTMLVEPGAFPYEHKQLPFTQIGQVPIPGTPHYTASTTYLRDPQMETNKFHAQRISIRQTFSNPKWFIDSELELDADPDDSPNQILRGNSRNGALIPQILQPTNMPNADAEGNWISEEMMNVVGLHEVSQAQVPGRVESSKAIELLKEADTSRQAELGRTIKSAIATGYWQQLQLAKQYMKEEKLVSVYSREGLPEVRRFKKDSVKPGMHVRVTMQTGLAFSRAAREEQVISMWQAGIIRDPEVAAELLDIPSGVISPHRGFDIRLARNENFTLAESTAIIPNSWDDHEVHIREHNQFRKTTEYLQLDDDAKSMFEHHVSRHKELQLAVLQEEVEKVALMQAAAAGSPGSSQSTPAQATGAAPPRDESDNQPA